MTPELQDRYFREFMYEMDQKSRMRTAREDGIAEGRAEEKAETARAMKADGLSFDIISKYTGLTLEQIESL